MEKESFIKYIDERYNNQVKWYDEKSRSNQRIYKFLQWIIIIFTSITPILILQHEYYLHVIAAILAITVAISAGAQKAFNFQENWINYRSTCEILKKEYFFYINKVQGYENITNPEGLFLERVESIISKENVYWIATYNKKPEEETKIS